MAKQKKANFSTPKDGLTSYSKFTVLFSVLAVLSGIFSVAVYLLDFFKNKSASIGSVIGDFNLGNVLVILIPAFFILFVIAIRGLVSDAAKVKKAAKVIFSESEHRAKRDQEAVLRLLDDLTEVSNGNLTVEAQVTEEFTGVIADSVNYAIESMRELVGTINRTALEVSTASSDSKKVSDAMRLTSDEQFKKVNEVSSIIDAMVSSLEKTSKSTVDATEMANYSLKIANEGAKRVQDTVGGMSSIRENIQETSKRIKRLGESSQEIGNIIEIINDIANQTNILALNASIQATNGSGRGFGMVAEEVQRLAERTSSSTKKIESLIKSIQVETNEAIASMEKSTSEVVRGTDLAAEAGQSLSKIDEVSKSLAGLIDLVSDSSKDVTLMAGNISEKMKELNSLTTKTISSISKTSSSIENLNALSDEMKNSVSGFTLPKGYYDK